MKVGDVLVDSQNLVINARLTHTLKSGELDMPESQTLYQTCMELDDGGEPSRSIRMSPFKSKGIG